MSETGQQQLTTEDLAAAGSTSNRSASADPTIAEEKPADTRTAMAPPPPPPPAPESQANGRESHYHTDDATSTADASDEEESRPMATRGERQAYGAPERPSSGSMGSWNAPNSAAPLGMPTGSRGPEAATAGGSSSPGVTDSAEGRPGSEADSTPRQGLLTDNEGFRERWDGIQTGFVDEPRRAVEQADALVAEVIQHLARSFAEERSSLEKAWAGGDTVSTEDLRVSLRRYREFFQVLLRS
jgi:hypothetical protein